MHAERSRCRGVRQGTRLGNGRRQYVFRYAQDDGVDREVKARSKKNGTVGCVVLDKQGNLTAGTSTGGMFKKRWGRIGDSPVIGAGTYADNNSCAVSCTGHGEYFIRHAVAFDVCARYKYLKESVEKAADYIIHTN